jgi:hypothetical protein
MRIVLRVLLAAACFAAGALCGFYLSWRGASYTHEAYQAADLGLLSSYLLTQSIKGTPAAHEAALLDYLALLKRMESHQSAIFTARIVAVDEALTYARLADLARQRSDTAAAAGYLASAAALCPELTWEHCSTADIADFAARLDKQKGSWVP